MNNEPYLTSWTVEGGDYSDSEFVEITLSAHGFYPRDGGALIGREVQGVPPPRGHPAGDMKMNKNVVVAVLLTVMLLWLSGCLGGGAGGRGGVGPEDARAVHAGSVPVVALFTPEPRPSTRRLLEPDDDEHRITGFGSDGEGGYNASYRGTDGSRRTISLVPSGPDYFTAEDEDEDLSVQLQFLGRDSRTILGLDGRHSFLREDFEHLAIAGFRVGVDEDFYRGYLVHGDKTAPDNLPLGSVTYYGKMIAEREFDDTGHLYGHARVTGNVTLTADFARSSLEGVIDGLYVEESPQYRNEFFPDARFVLDSGTLAGNAFAANVRGYGGFLEGLTGSVDGRFFGPGAEELGGVLGAGADQGSFFFGYIVGETGALPPPPSENEVAALISMNRSVLQGAWRRAAKSSPWSQDANVTLSDSGRNSIVDTRFDGGRLRVTLLNSQTSGLRTFETDHDAGTGGPSTSLFLKDSDDTASAAMLTADWTDPAGSDYLASGTWIHLTGRDPQTGQFTGVEMGAFVDGPALSDPSHFSIPSNYAFSAQYLGRARGLYAIHYGSGFGDFPSGSHASGTFSANFSRGCMGCAANVRVDGGDILLSGVFTDGDTGEETEIIDQPAPFRLGIGPQSGFFWAEGSDPSRPDHPFVEKGRPTLVRQTSWAGKAFGSSEVGGVGSMPRRRAGIVAAADTYIEGSSFAFLGTYETYGPWEDEMDASLHFSLNAGGEVLAYGIGTLDGVGGAWYFGPSPSIPFNHSPLFWTRGEFEHLKHRYLEDREPWTWSGQLWGYTPTSDAVHGVVKLLIPPVSYNDNDEPRGTLEVTALEWWPGEEPGSVGSGRMWGDGDLAYNVRFGEDSNGFNNWSVPSRDAGVVYGRLFGSSHEAVAGQISRNDLKAVFAGRR